MGNGYPSDINSWKDLEQTYETFKKENPWGWRGIKAIPAAIALLVCGVSSCYTVGPDEEGIIRRIGRYDRSTKPGLHLKLPWPFERVDFVKVTEVKKLEFGFRTKQPGIQTLYENKDYPEESLMLTGDKSIVDLEFIVQYKIKNAPNYKFNVRNPDETLRDAAEAAVRMEVGDRGIDDALTSGRADIQNAVQKRLQGIVDGYKAGIHIINVKLQDVHPPAGAVQTAFKRVNGARQERTRMVNEAWEAYNKVIPRAKGKAENTIKKAEAYSVERVNQSEGDAKKFEEIHAAYKDAPDITRMRMYLETLTKILPGFGEKIIIEDEVGKSVFKLLDLSPEGGKKK